MQSACNFSTHNHDTFIFLKMFSKATSGMMTNRIFLKKPLHLAHAIKSLAILLHFSLGRLQTINCPLFNSLFVLNLKFPFFCKISIIFFLSVLFLGKAANFFRFVAMDVFQMPSKLFLQLSPKNTIVLFSRLIRSFYLHYFIIAYGCTIINLCRI